jgi:hypothetical protein
MKKSVIVTASLDNTLKGWEEQENSPGKEWKNIHTLTAHTHWVSGEDYPFFCLYFTLFL